MNKDFPGKVHGGSVARTLCFHCQRPGFIQILVRELRSHKPQGAAKKKFSWDWVCPSGSWKRQTDSPIDSDVFSAQVG